MKIGVFPGSFDPIHMGHLMLASYISQWTDIDELWMLISRRNPLKRQIKAPDEDRFQMALDAVDDSKRIKVSDFEFSLPEPSYTLTTLNALSENYPGTEFSLIIGSDNWLILDRWKEFETIIEKFSIIIFPRPGYELTEKDLRKYNYLNPKGVCYLSDAPQNSLSSTFIRECIKNNKSVNYFIPDEVRNYIEIKGLYR